MKSRKLNSFLFLVVLLTAVVYSCDESLPDPIYGNKPVADFTATQSQSDIYTWSFTNNSSGAVSYNWDFGDGNGSSEANPSHTYTGAGQFAVTLTATAAGTSNSLGWRTTSTQPVQIDLPTYTTADVTFSVDMKNAMLNEGDVVNLNGSDELGGWCGGCNVMTDEDGNGVYEITMNLPTNKLYEYKFTINGWNAQESFSEADGCAYQAPGSPYWNRPLELGNLEQTVTLNTSCYDTCEECIDYASLVKGTWRLDGYKVGPGKDDGGWWTFNPADQNRDCHTDDTYTFGDGTFSIDHGTETWLEGWQGVSSEGCGAPVAPHVNNNSHSYTVAGTMVTVTGEGAYIGLAKAHNGGEDGNSGGTITYEILEVSSTNLKLTLDYCNGGCFWTYDLVKQ